MIVIHCRIHFQSANSSSYNKSKTSVTTVHTISEVHKHNKILVNSASTCSFTIITRLIYFLIVVTCCTSTHRIRMWMRFIKLWKTPRCETHPNNFPFHSKYISLLTVSSSKASRKVSSSISASNRSGFRAIN